MGPTPVRKLNAARDADPAWYLTATQKNPMIKIIQKTYPSKRRRALVEDLVPLIIAAGEPWPTSELARMARVSPSWKFPVEKMLYSSITLTSARQWPLLSRTLRTRLDLAKLVTRLHFENDDVERVPRTLESALEGMEMLFRTLFRVTSLKVGANAPFARASLLKAMEQLPNPMHLEELDIVGPYNGAPVARNIPRMVDRSLIWTDSTPGKALKTLRLTNVHLTFRMPIDSRGFPPNLTSLYLNNATIPNLISLRVFPPLQSLEVVTTASRHLDPFSQIRPIAEATHETLEHISHTVTHEIQGVSWGIYQWPEFPLCPKLKTLETDTHLYGSEWFPRFDMSQRLPALESWTVWGIPESDRLGEDGEDDTI
ncbi:hypothetical protein FRC00_013271 [Tulasnella sp. 408]|nr:hypothetical protein FRC00_013271 [Tulasnella sp. 408]